MERDEGDLRLDPAADAAVGADPAGQALEADRGAGEPGEAAFDHGAELVERRAEAVGGFEQVDRAEPRRVTCAAADVGARLLAWGDQLQLAWVCRDRGVES